MSESPKINIRFVFNMCNDVEPMRHFYTELLGMEEISYMKSDDFQWLCYQCEGFQLMFFGAVEDEPMPVPEEWIWQPGWGGDINGTSWAIEYPEDMFRELVAAVQADDTVLLHEPEPVWRQESYWGLTVKDPMGTSIELYNSPAEKPESTEWSDNQD